MSGLNLLLLVSWGLILAGGLGAVILIERDFRKERKRKRERLEEFKRAKIAMEDREDTNA